MDDITDSLPIQALLDLHPSHPMRTRYDGVRMVWVHRRSRPAGWRVASALRIRGLGGA